MDEARLVNIFLNVFSTVIMVLGWLIYLQTDNIYYFGIGVGIGIVIAVLARIFWRTPHRRDGDGDSGSGFSDFFDGDSGGND